MKIPFPKTLFGQTLLILLAGIGLALIAGAWIYSSARREAVRAVGALAAVERIVNLSRLVAEVPPEWRARIVERSSDAAFRITLSAQRPLLRDIENEPIASTAIVELLQEALPGRAVAAAVTASAGGPPRGYARGPGQGLGQGFGQGFGQGRGQGFGHGPGPGAGMKGPGYFRGLANGSGREGPEMYGPHMRAAMSWRDLEATVQIGEGQWLAFATALPEAGLAISSNLLIALGLVSAAIVLLAAFAARRVVAPLQLLSDAAERLGRNVESPPLAPSGALEIRRAAAAFNDMQTRLRRFVENRTLMLAAISHDLRTQLTLLRLRVENGDAQDDRARMLKTIAEMEDMLAATLSFARDDASREEARRIDIGALVASLVDDMADAGLDVECLEMAGPIEGAVKPLALRRAISNLLDNAIKYGMRARVSAQVQNGQVEIAVEDDGPGIPEDKIAEALQPFARVEDSRNRDTGGMGLGLAIAASVAHAHGGELKLVNRPQGGLKATLIFPYASTSK